MAEWSGLWTSGAGDGHPYSMDELAEYIISTLVENPSGSIGVFPNIGLELIPTNPSGNTVRINTGRAFVNGLIYVNDEILDIVVDAATVGNTGCRLVIRKDWAAQTVRATIVRNTPGTAAIPPLVQTTDALWDIPIAQFVISTAGVISSFVDNRQFLREYLIASEIEAQIDANLVPVNSSISTINGQITGINNSITAIVADKNKLYYGDGSDGAVSINLGTTTLTRDMYYTTLTIGAGATLNTAGFRVFCSVSAVINGLMHNNGNLVNGAPSGTVGGGGDGTPGTNHGGGGGGIVYLAAPSISGSGTVQAKGGTSGPDGTATARLGGTVTPPVEAVGGVRWYRSALSALLARTLDGAMVTGGAGGGGQSGTATNGTSMTNSIGGAGADASSSSTKGGGGGGIILISDTAATVNTDVSPGTNGAGFGSSDSGTVINVVL